MSEWKSRDKSNDESSGADRQLRPDPIDKQSNGGVRRVRPGDISKASFLHLRGGCDHRNIYNKSQSIPEVSEDVIPFRVKILLPSVDRAPPIIQLASVVCSVVLTY